MKPSILVLIFCIFSALPIFSQAFGDDFESYNVGDYIGLLSTEWTTWTGASGEGTSTDTKVTDEIALSGTKSLKFESSAVNGGPTDIYLPFGDTYSTGTMIVSLSIYVTPGTGAYFNLQNELTAGESWACDMEFHPASDSTGVADFELDDGTAQSNLYVTGKYIQGAWTSIKFNIDLDSNQWKLIVNGVHEGTFEDTENTIGGLNLFAYDPTAGANAVFYVDDVSYVYSVNTKTEEIDATASAVIYPNPASQILSVEHREVAIHYMDLYSLNGQLIQHKGELNSRQEKIDVSQLQDGLYHLKIGYHNGEIEVQRISIVHD